MLELQISMKTWGTIYLNNYLYPDLVSSQNHFKTLKCSHYECLWAYKPVMISFLCFALSLHLASLLQQLATAWPCRACLLDGRRGRMEKEELTLLTITTVRLRGLGRSCRYSRSAGWLNTMHWTETLFNLCVEPPSLFPLVSRLFIHKKWWKVTTSTSESLFTSFSWSIVHFFPAFLYVPLSGILCDTLDQIFLVTPF